MKNKFTEICEQVTNFVRTVTPFSQQLESRVIFKAKRTLPATTGTTSTTSTAGTTSSLPVTTSSAPVSMDLSRDAASLPVTTSSSSSAATTTTTVASATSAPQSLIFTAPANTVAPAGKKQKLNGSESAPMILRPVVQATDEQVDKAVKKALGKRPRGG